MYHDILHFKLMFFYVLQHMIQERSGRVLQALSPYQSPSTSPSSSPTRGRSTSPVTHWPLLRFRSPPPKGASVSSSEGDEGEM